MFATLDRLLPFTYTNIDVPNDLNRSLFELQDLIMKVSGRDITDSIYDELSTKLVQTLGAIQKEKWRDEAQSKSRESKSKGK
jgi:hypothetical protein